jgi:tRNA threonylcarbamoyladenosine biosynthesis protein TsaB
VRERFQIAPRGHGDLILQQVDELMSEAGLKPAQLDGLAFGRGPGAFTGVRIATSVAQGIAFAVDLPVLPVSTLEALAQADFRQHGDRAVACAIDARMGEVYWAAYRMDDEWQLLAAERVCLPAAVELPQGDDWVGVGSGWREFEDELNSKVDGRCQIRDAELLPHAYDVATLGERELKAGRGLPAAQALPVYLRDNVAEKKKQ